MSDPFAAAAAAEAARQAAAQSNAQPAQSDSIDEDEGSSSIFGGEKLPSIFNKFVMPNTERSGIITKLPVDKQSRDVDGKPKFWDDNAPEGKQVVTYNTGNPLNDTVFVLQTEYRFTEQEIADQRLDRMDVQDDKGIRGIYASGDLKKAIQRAIREAGIRRSNQRDLIGMRLTVNRGTKVPIPGTQKTRWTGATARLEKVS